MIKTGRESYREAVSYIIKYHKFAQTTDMWYHNNLILKNLRLLASIPRWHQPVIENITKTADL